MIIAWENEEFPDEARIQQMFRSLGVYIFEVPRVAGQPESYRELERSVYSFDVLNLYRSIWKSPFERARLLELGRLLGRHAYCINILRGAREFQGSVNW